MGYQNPWLFFLPNSLYKDYRDRKKLSHVMWVLEVLVYANHHIPCLVFLHIFLVFYILCLQIDGLSIRHIILFHV